MDRYALCFLCFVSLTCVAEPTPLTTATLRLQLNDPYATVNPIGAMEQRIPDDHNVTLTPVPHRSCMIRLTYRKVQRGDAELLQRQIFEYARSAPLCALILDLSENRGGFVFDGLEIVDLFVSRAHVMSKRELKGKVAMFLTHTDGGPLEKLPHIVHVGPSTASTAEFIVWHFMIWTGQQ